jgi:hypothetical protein
MNKFLAALAVAGVVLPTMQPVVDVLGGNASVITQIAGIGLGVTTKAVIDIQGILAKRKEEQARKKAALR